MNLDDTLHMLQWPAMTLTIFAAWCVGSDKERLRSAGFWIYLLSNAAWVAWGWATQAWALVILQFFLAATNLRGIRQNTS